MNLSVDELTDIVQRNIRESRRTTLIALRGIAEEQNDGTDKATIRQAAETLASIWKLADEPGEQA